MTLMEKKPRWNKALVIEAAGRLADAEGLSAVTLTRLAETLGIRPPSLFNHVDSLGALVHELALSALDELSHAWDEALAVPAAPAEALVGVMAAYRDYVKAHPGRYAATLAVPAAQANEDPRWAEIGDRIVSSGLALAARFGLEGEEGVHALRGWRALAHGFSDLERQGGFGLPLDAEQSYLRAIASLTPKPQR
jgi:AcrR family transcriptional regulator